MWNPTKVLEMVETGACRDYDDFFSRTRYTVPEGAASTKSNLHAATDLPPNECEGAFPKGVLDENGRMETFNNGLLIRYLDRVVVKDDGYEVAFKAGVTVEVEI